MFCKQCGTPIAPNGKFCPKCGAPVTAPAQQSQIQHSAVPNQQSYQQQGQQQGYQQPPRRDTSSSHIIILFRMVRVMAW
ncbi:zinc-ribbon domain-containing protein [Ruminococcus sp.]|uniref:zinc-ribbon domain-containing protein n=1 Tax=Ruminococcus sp. TaxID=41978 RepID=UPI003996A8E8